MKKNIITKETLEKIEQCLTRGKFDDAEEFFLNIDNEDIRDLILSYAYNYESLLIYSFVLHMKKYSEIFWTELAIELMLNPLCFIDGAYSIALYHSRKLLILDDKVENLERILFFSECPEKLIDMAESEFIAKKILKKEPDNKMALRFLNK